MKIIYAFNNDIYAAYKAAYLRLNLEFTKLGQGSMGINSNKKNTKLKYIGMDEEYNEIYISNYGRNISIFKNLLMGLADLTNEKVKIIIVD